MDWYQAEALVKEFYTDKGFMGLRGCNPFLSDRLFAFYETTKYEDVYDVRDRTYKRLIYSQIKNSFYNDYNDPTKMFGLENIDFSSEINISNFIKFCHYYNYFSSNFI